MIGLHIFVPKTASEPDVALGNEAPGPILRRVKYRRVRHA